MSTRRRNALVIVGLVWLMLPGSAQAAGRTLTYYGGPVAHSMNVVLVNWGSSVRSTYTDPTSGDPAFFGYLSSQSGATSDIGGVLAQYMDTTGHNSQNRYGYAGSAQITPSNSTTVQDSTIQSQLKSNIQSSTLPAPAGDGMSTIYVVLFPPGTNVCLDGTCAYDVNGFCAYHGSFQLSSSTQVLYAAMVDNGPGTPNYGLCGPSSDDLANQTEVVSHEFAETINDPLVAEAPGNGPPLAWYNQSQGEIGDICEGQNEQAPNGPWTVQKIWSNIDNSCVASESAYAAPLASFIAPSSGTSGQQLSFDGSGSSDPSQDNASATYNKTTYSISSGISSYQWNWGDGSSSAPSSTPTATHTYASPGTYQASLTVTNDLGFTSTVTHQVSVSGVSNTGSGSNGRGSNTVTPAPSVSTGAASGVTSSGTKVSGTVNPHGVHTTYLVEFGTTTAYGHSSVATSAGAGTSNVPVSTTLSGLRSKTTYHYRLVASSAGGTAVGAGRTFTTTRPPASPPRFSFKAPSRSALRAALGRRLKVRFRCSKACVAHFVITVASPGIAQGASAPLTVAKGQGRLRSAGSGTATLVFKPRLRKRLRRSKPLTLVISGYAVGAGTRPSAPRTVRLTLR